MDELLKFAPRPTGAGEMFQLLRDGQPRTRAELAAITGQARSTIAARVDLLSATGLIGPSGEATSTGGRPPTTFAFQPGARIVLCVDLGATHARLAVTDLGARILAQRNADLAISDGPAAVLAWVADAGRALIAEAGRSPAELVSVGVGLPGPVEHTSGRPISPPIMPGWDGWDVRATLTQALGVPVLIDNDVNIMALGEHRTAWPAVSDLLFIKVATGIGAGIISDGELQRGAQGVAGDIGHIASPGAAGVLCRCGNTGCLEAIASGAALVQQLRAEGADVATSADVAALVRAGDATASRLVRQAGREIGSVLAVCVSVLNPSLISIGGIVAEAGELLLAGIRESVYSRSLPIATEHLRIVGSRTQSTAGILGASAMAVDHVLSPRAIDAHIQ